MYFLENEQIGLRYLSEQDVEGAYVDWFNDIEVCKYNAHHRFPMTRTMLLDFVKSSNIDRNSMVFAVDKKKDSRHIGNISLQQIDYLNRQAEIAFMFGDKGSRGKGYATQAAVLMIDHAFMELGMNRIYFGTSEENIAMQKVGEKLNFHYGGVKRKALYKHGKFVDIYEYDLLREEWMLSKNE